MTLRIAFDIDDTLLDWRGAFRDWMIDTGHPSAISADDFAEATFKQAWPNIPGAHLRDFGERFNSSPEFMNLRVLPGVIETLRAVRAARNTCLAISAPGTHPAATAARHAQIDVLGFTERVLLPYQADKAGAVLQVRADVLVDDNPSTLLAARERGIPIIVKDLPSNRSIDAPRILTWTPKVFAATLHEALAASKSRTSRGQER